VITPTVETTPRITLSELRSNPNWPSIQREGRVSLFIDDGDDERKVYDVELETLITQGGVHHWLTCPRCASRRANLHLVEGELACRRCHGLLYYEQALPRTVWKRKIGVPAMRCLGGFTRGAAGERATCR